MVGHLPELVTFEQHNGDWKLYVEVIYKYYLDELVNVDLFYKNLPVKFKFFPPYNNKGFGFWHAISEGNDEENRQPNIRRCERIRWIPWIIKRADTINSISCWENKRGSETHTVIFMEEESYVVILAKRSGYYLFKTAYCATPKRKMQLIKEREVYQRQKKAEGAI